MTNEDYRQVYNEFTEGKKELIEKFYNISKIVTQSLSLPTMFSGNWMVYNPQKSIIKDGIYLTARIQIGGYVYTMLNEYKDGEWQGRCLDGGYTIAYQEITKEEFKTLCGEYQNQESQLKANLLRKLLKKCKECLN